jgi:hypothetical protein
MYKLSKGDFIKEIKKAKTEEEVKFAYTKAFKIKFNAAYKHDLYTPQIFFEFKYDKNFENIKVRAEILAQALYYLHRLKYGTNNLAIPPVICLADKNEAAFTETELWKVFYTDTDEKYDWDLAPSQPDKTLVADLYATLEIRKVHIYKLELEHEFDNFKERLFKYLSPQIKFAFGDKKLITEDNFESVYGYWENNFGEAVRNGQKPSKYFIADIQEGRTFQKPDESKVLFKISETDYREKKILPKDYDYFWSLYEKVSNPYIIRGIISKADRLTDEDLRRFNGEFFTPLEFAKKGLEYIEKTIGKKWWTKGYKLWDMAAGTGNLQYHLPYDAWEHCYLSTLHKEDVEHLTKLFPESKVFQYDYLNDDIDNLFADNQLPFNSHWKLPEKLRIDLNNPETKWIILINPPFATSQEAGTNHGRSKKDASNTKLRTIMHNDNLGEVSRELFSQFIFRINKEFRNKQAHLCMYSKLKYLNANNDQLLRDNIFQYNLEKGFMFSVEHFHGTKGKFPVGFLVWDLNKRIKLEDQKIELDIFEEPILKIGTKIILNESREKFLSKWIDRPAGVKIFPPFKSGITVAISSNKDVRDRISENFLACLMCAGNDLQHQNNTCILSGPYVSAGALSITQENFEKSMVVHAVRRLPKATWINDRDQFMQPSTELPKEFIADCTVWNLFSNSNQTVAMKDVKYKGNTYQVHNHFFPFLIKGVKKWKLADSDIAITITNDEDRFVAEWLAKQDLSDEAMAIITLCKEIYKFYFANLNKIRTGKFKIQTWDAGWWQIRNSLADESLEEELFKEIKIAHSKLRDKLLPQISEYGFLG